MKLTKTKRFGVKDTDVVFVLRNPTDMEYNEYYSERFDKNNMASARANLFDTLLVGVENLEDEEGVIGVERKSSIPIKWKAEAIFKAFDENEVVDAKN